MLDDRRLCGRADTDLADYLRQIRRLTMPAPEVQLELARRWRQHGDQEARDRLVCGNLRLVVYIAKRYANLGVPMQDLVEAGNLGLIQAVDRFDPAVGARFASYAVWWIRRGVAGAIAEHSSMVHLPDAQRRIRQICRDAAQRLAVERSGAVSAEEIATETGLSVRAVRRVGAAPVATAQASADSDPMAALPDSRQDAPEDSLLRDETRERVRRCLANLPAAEAQIVRLHYGIDRRKPVSVRQIADELGIGRDRVHRLLRAALGRMAFMMRNETDAMARTA